MTKILAHGIGGGWDLRHEGCAPKCCEKVAERVGPATVCRSCGRRFAHTLGCDACSTCSGCGEPLNRAPAPMDFDRDAPCEQHAADAVFEAHRKADPHCTCNDCLAWHYASEGARS